MSDLIPVGPSEDEESSGVLRFVLDLKGGSADPTASVGEPNVIENIKDTDVVALPLINSIQMHQFDWKNDGGHQCIGMIADELEQLDSKLSIDGGYDERGRMNVKSVDTLYLMGYLVKAVQELSAEVEQLKKSKE